CSMLAVSDVTRCCVLTSYAAADISSLSLHDALPISSGGLSPELGPGGLGVGERVVRVGVLVGAEGVELVGQPFGDAVVAGWVGRDRKSTRLNSSHVKISYAVFCSRTKKTGAWATLVV